ncbi:MAG: DUF5336 domain-containing protein [Gordonia sp. (in: high G+C Gram-positive bacteria)]|uniref:DUF5336 domain-containing protein n=1 Tax=Gordonia sp. (in: high G+C Gram-positive bacteria) TaxID=84139 RepID=UPI0039E48D1B
MTYPQSGQGQQYGQQYGQAAGQAPQYGQQYAGQADQYGQQYAQGQYAQAGYGQQYTAPKPPSQGVPANTATILAGGVAFLGIIEFFLGFLKVGSGGEYGYSAELFFTQLATPWALLSVAGVAAALSFVVGRNKHYAAAITALTIVSALNTIFMFATADGGLGTPGILLLVFSIIAALLALFWLLIENGNVKTAPAVATAGATTDSQAAVGAYGQQAVDAYGQAAPQVSAPAAPAYGQGYGQTSYGSYGQAQAPDVSAESTTTFNPMPGAHGADDGATTTFSTGAHTADEQADENK